MPALTLLQVMPHPPQLPSSVVLAPQPLFGLPSQSAQPAEHTGSHTPPEHDVVPCGFVHAFPQLPQLPVLVCVSTHAPLHSVVP
jgi:hypothetical protein